MPCDIVSWGIRSILKQSNLNSYQGDKHMKVEIVRASQFARVNSFYGKTTTKVVTVEVKRTSKRQEVK